MNNTDDGRIIGTNRKLSISKKIFSMFRLDPKIGQYIPIGEEYDKLVRREIVSGLKEGVEKFRQLSKINNATKIKLYPVIRSHLKQIAIFARSLKVYLTSMGLFLYTFSFLIPSMIFPFVTPRILNVSIPFYVIVLYIIPCYFFIASHLYTYSYKSTMFFLKKVNPAAYFIAIICALVIQGIVIRLGILTSNDLIIYLISTPLLISMSGLLLYVLVFMTIILVIALRNMRLFRRFPVAFIANEHLQALSLLAKDSINSKDFDNQKKAAEHLLSASKYASIYLSKFLRIKDTNINAWSSVFVDEIASGIRNTAKLVIISASNEDLQNQITRNFIAIATSNFGDCITAQSEIISPKEKQKIFKDKVTTFTIGVIPLLGLYLLQRSNLIVNVGMLDYPIVFAGIWFILSIISIIDPSFSERIRAFKEIVGLFPSK